MRPRWRIMIVVLEESARGLRLASPEPVGLPPRDAAWLAAVWLRLGAEVRVLDEQAEGLAHRAVRRELRNWRPDLVVIHAGGPDLVDDPVPDGKALAGLLAGWAWDAPVLLAGPLARHHAAELLATHDVLAGALGGPAGSSLIGAWHPRRVPGLVTLDGDTLVTSDAPEDELPHVLPAWHTLPMGAYAAARPDGQLALGIGPLGDDLDRIRAEVRHAVNRAGARSIVFEDRDLGEQPDRAQDVARSMFAVAPGVPWSCRLRTDRVETGFVLALANGGCREVRLASPVGDDAPAATPMDDPVRPRLESAVETIRVTGMTPTVEHVIGRPGHDRAVLAAWQRWFADRGIVVRPKVRVLHAGSRGPGAPDLEEARRQAGCWDNELTAADVEKAVKAVTQPRAAESAR